MSLRRLAGLVVGVALFASPAAAWVPHRNATWGFTVDIGSWSVLPADAQDEADHVRLKIFSTGLRALCNVTASDHPNGHVAGQDEIDREYARTLDPKIFFNELPPSDPVSDARIWLATLGGAKAVMGEGTATLGTGRPLRFRKLWVVLPRRSYNMNCATDAGEFERARGEIEAIMASFRIGQGI